MNKTGFKNGWLSLAITFPIGTVGLFLLRDDPEAKGWLVLGLIVVGVNLMDFLDGRSNRARRKTERPR